MSGFNVGTLIRWIVWWFVTWRIRCYNMKSSSFYKELCKKSIDSANRLPLNVGIMNSTKSLEKKTNFVRRISLLLLTCVFLKVSFHTIGHTISFFWFHFNRVFIFFSKSVGLREVILPLYFSQHLACVCQKLANPNKKSINYTTFWSVGAAVLLYILPPPLKTWWFTIFFMIHCLKIGGKWIQFWLFEHIFLNRVGSFKKSTNSKSTARTLIPGKGMGTISSCCNANDVNLESEQRESKMQKDRSKTRFAPTVRPGKNVRMEKKQKRDA